MLSRSPPPIKLGARQSCRIYRARAEAEAAVDRLLKAGFRPEDVAVLMADNIGTKDFARTKATKAPKE